MFSIKEYRQGDIIYQQGSQPKKIYFIFEGTVKVTKTFDILEYFSKQRLQKIKMYITHGRDQLSKYIDTTLVAKLLNSKETSLAMATLDLGSKFGIQDFLDKSP